MAVSEDNKSLARYLRDVTQGSPTVTKYLDDAHLSDVAWLQVLPISDAERDYALANGPEALENLFEDRQIDVFDIDRPSTL